MCQFGADVQVGSEIAVESTPSVEFLVGDASDVSDK